MNLPSNNSNTTPSEEANVDVGPTGKLRFGSGTGGIDASKGAAKKMSQQSLVMAVVFAVSAAAIFGMRTLGTRAGIAMGGEVVDYTPPDMEKAKSYDRIMSEIARVQTPLDVTLGEFGKSPFMLEAPPQPVMLEGPGENPLDEATQKKQEQERKRAERIAHLSEKLGTLKLQSIMTGKRPLARISGETIQVGQTVLEEFVLMRIEDRSIVLTADDMQFELSLETHEPGKSGAVKVGKSGGKK